MNEDKVKILFEKEFQMELQGKGTHEDVPLLEAIDYYIDSIKRSLITGIAQGGKPPAKGKLKVSLSGRLQAEVGLLSNPKEEE